MREIQTIQIFKMGGTRWVRDTRRIQPTESALGGLIKVREPTGVCPRFSAYILCLRNLMFLWDS